MAIPKEVKIIIQKLQKAGFKAYVVGGCVRDFLLVHQSINEKGKEKDPEDWDIATSARPEEIQKIFPKSFYSNKFFTVTVQSDVKKANLKKIEITTFRSEAKYSDKRHPDKVSFAKTIEEDLSRRDFTINSIALEFLISNSQSPAIIDPFEGRKDLKDKIIRAVGDPDKRFNEDALRMMRAARFAVTLNFKIEEKTMEAIKKNASWLRAIAEERIKEEFMKIIMSKRAAEGVEILRQTGLLKYIIPELETGVGVSQNKHHIYECYEHGLRSLDFAAKSNFNQYVRLAALFHDIAKPKVKRGEGENATFYGHEMAGAKMTARILERLRFSKKDIEKIVKLVRYHLFYYNVDEVGDSSVRRLVRQVGPENMEELLEVRKADRIGSGVPKAEPYKLRHLKYVIEKVSQDPISVKMIKVSGSDVMRILKINPGPAVGQILDILLGYVLSDPGKNKKEFLEKEIGKIGKLPEKQIKSLADKARKEREKLEMKKDEMTKKKYWVT